MREVAERLAGAAVVAPLVEQRADDVREVRDLHAALDDPAEARAGRRSADVDVEPGLRASDESELGGVRAGTAVGASRDAQQQAFVGESASGELPLDDREDVRVRVEFS